MRTLAWVTFVGLVVSALLAAQARADEPASAGGAAEACGAHSQAGMRECIEGKVSDSAARLKQAEDQAAATIAKWDEDAKYIKLAKAKLQAANAAFKKYSQAQCAFASALGGGAIGNALEIRRLACLADTNAARAKELAETTSALPPK